MRALPTYETWEVLLGHPELTNNYPKTNTVFNTTIWPHEPYTQQKLISKLNIWANILNLGFFIYIEDVLTDTVNVLLMISTVYYNENKHNLCMII